MTAVSGSSHEADIMPSPAGWAVRCARRTMDITVATVLLLLASPVLLVAIVAIRLDSPGPAIFKQERIGEGGRRFTIFKLRGMYVDARSRWPELYDYGRYDAQSAAGMRFHNEGDPRVTPAGRFLRRTSIDELPNLVNVLLGDMHLVGPRPEIPDLARLYVGEASSILAARPGVTSLAKATGRDSLDFAQTIALELHYLKCRSLRSDIRILVRTAIGVVVQRHVTRGG